ncbi:hypothetical protein HRbin30_00333 [bacterium HR30]|nr:hypothetical protein HRbin30_00333 [bacterium HR30]
MAQEGSTELFIRRAHWRDFDAVASLVAQCGAGSLLPERRTLRRFRNIVHDLGNDLYLAFSRDVLVGLVHIVYVRELVAPRRAEISSIFVSPGVANVGVGEFLLSFARKRAQKRDCQVVVFRASESNRSVVPLLAAGGFRQAGQWYVADLLQEEHPQGLKEG